MEYRRRSPSGGRRVLGARSTVENCTASIPYFDYSDDERSTSESTGGRAKVLRVVRKDFSVLGLHENSQSIGWTIRSLSNYLVLG